MGSTPGYDRVRCTFSGFFQCKVQRTYRSPHAPWLVAGYNTATKKEKENIDEKKLSRIVGVGILPISALVLTMALLIDTLSTFFIYIFVLFTLLDTVLMIVAANKYSRKR